MRMAAAVFACGWVAACSAAATSAVGEAGQVVRDGRPVAPMIVYAQPAYLFDYHRQLGFDSVFNPNPESLPGRTKVDPVKAAGERGLGSIAGFDAARVGDPAVWAWIGPVLEPGQLRRVDEEAAKIRAADPSRLIVGHIDAETFLAGRQAAFYAEAVKRVDAVIAHPWPGLLDENNRDLQMVGRFVDEVRRLCAGRAGGEVSIWVEINPHRWSLAERHGGRKFPAPTPAELRYQIFLALIRGADGIVIFPISFDPFVYSQIPTKNERALVRCGDLLRRLAPVLTAPPSPLGIEVKSEESDGLIDVATRVVGDSHYVFALNGRKDSQQVRLALPAGGARWTLIDALSGQPVAFSGRECRQTLRPLGLNVWRLDPAAPKDASKARPKAAAPKAKAGPDEM